MSPLLFIAALWLTISLAGITFIQVLYLESLRLRSRELPALEFFKQTLKERLGLKTERGALSFSLLKHSTILLLGVAVLGFTAQRGGLGWQSILEAAVVSWLLLLTAGYAVPQMLYRKTEGRWALPLVPVFRFLAFTVRPLVALLTFVEAVVDLAEAEDSEQEPPTPEEHIEALISAGAEEGLIEEEDRKLIQAAVAFGDKTVREVMTPRPKIVAIDADRSLDDLRDLLIHEQYSRIPVFEGSIDSIVGFVHARDVLELDEEDRKHGKVRDLMRPVRLVPETKPVHELLKEMQEDRAHMVIVVDEYGNTAGLATMEDLVEEILGEIRDEHEPEIDVTPDGEGRYIISGSFELNRLQDLLGFRPPEGTESTTVSGLAAEWLGHVPAAGEVAERHGLRIEVLAGNEMRVDLVRVMRSPNENHV
jgi:CBS domain containing-hemolysin-like protein